jgi:hypothetical protein
MRLGIRLVLFGVDDDDNQIILRDHEWHDLDLCDSAIAFESCATIVDEAVEDV